MKPSTAKATKAVKRVADSMNALKTSTAKATDAVDALIAAGAKERKPKGWAAAKKERQRKSMKERIGDAIERAESHSRWAGEGIIKSTGQLCYDFPWKAAAPRPWRDGYTRVIIPLGSPTRKGKRCIVQIVHNSKLSHGRHTS